MKKLICLFVVLLLVGWFSPVMADELGLGGIYIIGAHSDDGSFAMENEGDKGWGINVHYDVDLDWKKQLSTNHAFGIEPGLDYKYLSWTKSLNLEKKVLYYDEVQKTEKYRESEKVYSQIFSATLKPYWEIYKDFRLFTLGGVGYEFTEKSKDGLVLSGGVGMQYFFTEKLGASLSVEEVYSSPTGDFKRWELATLRVLCRF